MNILAIDPATSCGWAHSCGACGSWDLTIRRDESKGMRLIRLRGKLSEIKRDVGIDLVVYEAARHAGPGMQGSLVVQAELQGVICLWCEDNGVEYRGYSPSEIKRHATGKGNCNKQAMVSAAKLRWPEIAGIISEDMADALWILDYATTTLTPS